MSLATFKSHYCYQAQYSGQFLDRLARSLKRTLTAILRNRPTSFILSVVRVIAVSPHGLDTFGCGIMMTGIEQSRGIEPSAH